MATEWFLRVSIIGGMKYAFALGVSEIEAQEDRLASQRARALLVPIRVVFEDSYFLLSSWARRRTLAFAGVGRVHRSLASLRMTKKFD